ncbi:MAG: hypothetical protein ACLR23_02445 [Clostridia bacterium]
MRKGDGRHGARSNNRIAGQLFGESVGAGQRPAILLADFIAAAGAQQCAYEIRVSSTLEQAQAMAGDVYASGRVLSSVSTHVELPNGVVLQPRCRYYWSVSAWNEQGERLNSEIAILRQEKGGRGGAAIGLRPPFAENE